MVASINYLIKPRWSDRRPRGKGWGRRLSSQGKRQKAKLRALFTSRLLLTSPIDESY